MVVNVSAKIRIREIGNRELGNWEIFDLNRHFQSNIKNSTSNIQHSTFKIQHSSSATLIFQRPVAHSSETFTIQHPLVGKV
jgi:hypothetical protein